MSTNILTIQYKKILLIIRPSVNELNEALIGRLDDVLDKAAANGSICMLHIRSDQKAFSPELDDFTTIQRLVFGSQTSSTRVRRNIHCKERYR